MIVGTTTLQPALKTSKSKATLFFEALSRVKIGNSLYEPTCLFFAQTEEAKTPSKFDETIEDEKVFVSQSEKKPQNPKKSQYCSIQKQ